MQHLQIILTGKVQELIYSCCTAGQLTHSTSINASGSTGKGSWISYFDGQLHVARMAKEFLENRRGSLVIGGKHLVSGLHAVWAMTN